MAKVYDRPVLLQRINESTEKWETVYKLHASVNKSSNDNEYLGSGAIRSKRTLTFEIRYFKELEDIAYNTQSYRLKYENNEFNIIDYDDYKLRHKSVKLLGESY